MKGILSSLILFISIVTYSQPIEPLIDALNYQDHEDPIINVKFTITGKDGIPRTTLTALGTLRYAMRYEYGIDLQNDTLINHRIRQLYLDGIDFKKRKAIKYLSPVEYSFAQYQEFIKSEKLDKVLNKYYKRVSDFEEAMNDRNSPLWYEELSEQIDFLDLNDNEVDMLFEYLWNNNILVIQKHGPWCRVADFSKFIDFMENR